MHHLHNTHLCLLVNSSPSLSDGTFIWNVSFHFREAWDSVWLSGHTHSGRQCWNVQKWRLERRAFKKERQGRNPQALIHVCIRIHMQRWKIKTSALNTTTCRESTLCARVFLHGMFVSLRYLIRSCIWFWRKTLKKLWSYYASDDWRSGPITGVIRLNLAEA